MVGSFDDSPLDRTNGIWETLTHIADRDADFEETVDGVLESVSRAVGTDYATLSRVHPDAGRYVFERVVHPPKSALQSGLTEPLSHLPNCARVVANEETLVVADVPTEAPELDHPAWGIESYLGSPVIVEGEVYGTCCFFDVEPREKAFPEWGVEIAECVAQWLGATIERRDRLEHLDSRCNHEGVIREAAIEALEADDRSAMAAAVCRRLASRDGYGAAWIAEPDPGDETLRLLAASGLGQRAESPPIDLDAISAQAAPGPRAYETGEVQISRTASTGNEFEAQRPGAVIGVPLAGASATRGALAIRADNANTFERGERRALADLGQLLAHAITAAERQRLMTGETVITLELRVRGALPVADPPAVRIEFDDIVCLQDGSVVGFGEVDSAALDQAYTLVESIPAVERLDRRGSTNGHASIELEANSLPLVSAAHGKSGTVEQAVLEGADLRARFIVPSEDEAQRLVQGINDEFPRTDVLSKRKVDRHDQPFRWPPVPKTMTDRQLETLQTAYVLGYYERPREASGADVADTLGVAPATFSQHRRAAERKLLRAIFDDVDQNP